MRLAELPSAFDLENSKKGTFPFLFNTKENEGYIGRLPEPRFYAPDNMDAKTRKDFFLWYDANKGLVFDLNRELVGYCINDVDVLTRACLKFHKMFIETCNVSPFTEFFTLASAYMGVYRRNNLQPSTIGILPPRGYRKKDNQSKTASMWLLREELKNNITIQHSLRGPEAIIGNMKVDGRYENKVFEFLGYFWHGHTCIKRGRYQKMGGNAEDTLEDRYERIIKRLALLRDAGCEVIFE